MCRADKYKMHVEMIAPVLHKTNTLIVLVDLTLRIQLFSYIKKYCPTFGTYPKIYCLIAGKAKLGV